MFAFLARLLGARDLDATIAHVLAGGDERVEQAMRELAESRRSPASGSRLDVPSSTWPPTIADCTRRS